MWENSEGGREEETNGPEWASPIENGSYEVGTK